MKSRTIALVIGISLIAGGIFNHYYSLYRYTVPEQLDDGWSTADLRDLGLNPYPLKILMNQISKGEYDKLHSILIVKDGYLVFEEYFDGYKFNYSGRLFRGENVEYDRDTLHHQGSVTKAFTSALIGKAIEQDYIESVDSPVFDYFPEYSQYLTSLKEEMTIEHLLTMTSGLDWNGMDVPISSRDHENDLIQLYIVDDPIEHILGNEMAAKPGSRWYYSCGDVILLGEIIKRATGQRIDFFAEENLFEPLGITDVEWSFIQPHIPLASGSHYMRPRDVTKFGYLFLNEGRWNGKQVLSSNWVEKTMETYITYNIPGWSEHYGDKYGYQWWQKTFTVNGQTYEAVIRSGWGCQKIVLFPKEDLLVVLNGGYYTESEPYNEIITEHVLKAIN